MSDDVISEVILLAREADEYMVRGEPHKAKPLYTRASEAIRAVLTSRQFRNLYERAAYMYTAALMAYNGGDYQTATSLAGSVSMNHMRSTPGATSLYEDAKLRSSPGYSSKLAADLAKSELRMASEGVDARVAARQVIDTLRDNPYVLSAPDAVKLRRRALAVLGMAAEAAAFEEDEKRLCVKRPKKPLRISSPPRDDDDRYTYSDFV